MYCIIPRPLNCLAMAQMMVGNYTSNFPAVDQGNGYNFNLRWRGQHNEFVMLCGFHVIIINFFGNSLFSLSMNTKIFAQKN